MGRKKKEMKVRIIEPKATVKVLNANGDDLEEEVENQELGQFSEFMSTGQTPSPVLNSGQNQQPGNRIEQTATEDMQQETPTRQPPSQTASFNPEFSMYEIARGVVRRETTRTRRQYEQARHHDDAVMQSSVSPVRINEMEDMTRRQKFDFSNPELDRLRAGDERRQYYEVKIDSGELEKRKRAAGAGGA